MDNTVTEDIEESTKTNENAVPDTYTYSDDSYSRTRSKNSETGTLDKIFESERNNDNLESYSTVTASQTEKTPSML